jgi:hypothetical protein
MNWQKFNKFHSFKILDLIKVPSPKGGKKGRSGT